MRSFTVFLMSLLLTAISALAHGQGMLDEEPAGSDSNLADSEIPGQKPAAAPDAEGAPAEGEGAPAKEEKAEGAQGDMVVDGEILADEEAEATPAEMDFIGLKATSAWVGRNGLGMTLGIGGLTCTRDYCNSTLDTQIFGSAAGTIGAYYRINPNVSVYGDGTFAYVNTNFNQVATGDVNASDEGAFEFQFLVGARFHVPVKGWLDLYAGGGLGFIMLRAKATAGGNDFTHRWAGFDIEIGMGADFYFWSVGPMKNFSVGPFFRVGFPIWAKLCAVSEGDGNEVCDRPSNHTNNNDYVWQETPFIFHTGIEARYDFGLEFGKTDRSEPDEDDASPKKKKKKKKKKVEENENWDL